MEPNDLNDKIDQAAEKAAAQAQRFMIQVLPESGKRVRLYCLLAALAAVLLLWFWPHPQAGAPARTWQPTPAAPGIDKLPLSDVAVKSVKVLPKQQAMHLLDMPEATPLSDGTTMASDTKQITATADLKPSRGGYTQAAVIDTTTGQTQIVSKEKPLPWFHLGGLTELGVGLGISTQGGEIGAVRIRQDIVNVKEVTVLAEGQLLAGATRPPEATGMVWAVARPDWFNY